MGISNPVTFPKRPPHGRLRRSCYGVANKDCGRADGLANDVHTEGSPDITSINENGHGLKSITLLGDKLGPGNPSQDWLSDQLRTPVVHWFFFFLCVACFVRQ